jgi:glucose-1-phosphate cytidylyltransferase
METIMKVVILAGGRGTRISEETNTIPKPMVEIGGKPILWHIMKIYSHYGINDFVVCLGYRGYLIKEYFSHYFLHMNDITIDMSSNDIKIHTTSSEAWKVTLVDTGLETMTGGRIKRVEKYVGKEPFMLTYGDGVGNVDLKALIEFHRKQGMMATITAVQPVGRFGSLDIGANDTIHSFMEKPKGDNRWINAGFFVLEPGAFDYISNDTTTWEREPLENIARNGQLNAYKHNGFWKPMDTLRDKIELETMWQAGKAPWKVWE